MQSGPVTGLPKTLQRHTRAGTGLMKLKHLVEGTQMFMRVDGRSGVQAGSNAPVHVRLLDILRQRVCRELGCDRDILQGCAKLVANLLVDRLHHFVAREHNLLQLSSFRVTLSARKAAPSTA